jgi:phage-related protein
MATELGKAFVQIVPSAKGISGAISKELGGEAGSAGQSAGLKIIGAIKGAIAAAGIGTALKSALEAGGNLQQSFGGLDTLYEDAAGAAKKYAVEAAAAGISANNYAEQAVSFGAALKSAFGGDTAKAAEAANTAIMDMADNAAKMGTPIENIQTAYQGFAKGQYQLLDNLKLGYGGTKTEMQRLLADASKLSGVEYNIDNLGDVYDAIHVIQQDLGLTGVAAQEASTTFTGSFGAMKAAAENLMANLALGQDLGPSLETLGQTVQTFAFNNLFPMITNILSQIPNLVGGAVDMIASSAPAFFDSAIKMATSLGEGLLTFDWMGAAIQLIDALSGSIDSATGSIFAGDTTVIDTFLSNLTNGFPQLLSKGVELLLKIVEGLLKSLPSIVTTAGTIVTKMTTTILSLLPSVLSSGTKLVLSLVDGIIRNLPSIIQSVVKIVTTFVATIGQNLPTILAQGITIVGKLVSGLIQAIPQIIAAIPQLISAIVNGFGNYDWPSIGKNLIKGIAEGLKNAAGMIADAARDAAKKAFEAAKDFLGIDSPAKKGIYIGNMYDAGIAEGIVKNKSLVNDAISDLNKDSFSGINASAKYDFSAPSEDTDKLDELLTLLRAYLPEIAEKEGVNINQLFNGINRQLGWGVQ